MAPFQLGGGEHGAGIYDAFEIATGLKDEVFDALHSILCTELFCRMTPEQNQPQLSRTVKWMGCFWQTVCIFEIRMMR